MVNMTTFNTWPEVVRCVACARDNGCMVTNFFADEKRMSRWCADGTFCFIEIEATLFLLHRQLGFSSLYFLSNSHESLAQDVASLVSANPTERIVVDVIGHDSVRLPIEKAFKASGFSQLTTLQRMSRKTTADHLVTFEADVVIPSIEEAQHIHDLLMHNFIAEQEQIPCVEEVEEWISLGEILAVKDIEKGIIGFVIFDLSPAVLYLRYWFVSPESRGKGVGGRLMRHMFSAGRNTKRQYFWVKTDNENAIKRYRHYGFEFEQLKDTVLATGEHEER